MHLRHRRWLNLHAPAQHTTTMSFEPISRVFYIQFLMLNLKKSFQKTQKDDRMKNFAHFENYRKRHSLVFRIFPPEDSVS